MDKGNPPAPSTGAGHFPQAPAVTPTVTIWYGAVSHGALLDAPVFHPGGRRANNFCALIPRLDPAAPGGVVREFYGRGKGIFKYIPPENRPPASGDLLEFGADYNLLPPVPSRKRRVYTRQCAVVCAYTPTALALALFPPDIPPGVAYGYRQAALDLYIGATCAGYSPAV